MMQLLSRTKAILAIAIATLLAAPAGQACSMKEGYRTPTDFELLEKAQLVVLGRLQTSASKPLDQHGMVTMVLEPIRVLKGQLPGQPLTLTSMKDWNGTLIPTLPTSLDQSHFSPGLGACVRIFYPPGGLILAMFQKGPEGWSQSWAAFARTAEDVEAEDGFWVRAAEAYVALQARARSGSGGKPSNRSFQNSKPAPRTR